MKKKILVSVDAGETRVAVLEAKGTGRGGDQTRQGQDEQQRQAARDWRVGELYVERRGSRSIVGNIYKGVVDNVLPGMEAAFVDIGLERNGFLHVDEIVTPDGKAAPKRGRGQGRRIDELIKRGQEIVVQVVKDPLKTKGARLSMQVSIAGRYLVYMPQGDGIGVSRRLPDGERTQMRKSLEKIHDAKKDKGGYIVRTAAQGARQEDFEREISYLHKLHEVLERRSADVEAPVADLPGGGSADPGAPRRARQRVRRLPRSTTRSSTSGSRRSSSARRRSSSTRSRCTPHTEHLFERHGAEEAFRSTLSRRVDLPSGGYLIIDYAEALTVIDINTGSLHRQGQGPARGHDHEGQRRGGRRGRPPAAAARHRRDHRHRLHRHGAGEEPRPGAEDAAQGARRGPDEDLRGRGLAARAGRDDPPERHRRRPRDPHRALPDLRRRGRGPLGRDGRDRGAAQAPRRGRRPSRSRRRT